MKFTSVFLICFLALTMAVNTGLREQAKLGFKSQMKELQKTSWGKVAASFLDLQMTVGSPCGELLQAFKDFAKDNKFKVDLNTQDFRWQENQHNGWVKGFEDQIARAKADIAAATSKLDNVLYPLKANLEAAIKRDNALIASTLAAMATATSDRKKNAAQHGQFVKEATEAIAAIDECLQLLTEIGTTAPSLIQMTKVQKSFSKLGAALKKTKYGSVVKALLKLADFANPAMLRRLVKKFKDVRASLVTGIANAQAEEAEQLEAFNKFMEISSTTVANARTRVKNNTAALKKCIKDIADTEAFRAARKIDLAQAEKDLADEHARWKGVVAIFDKLFAELANEASAIQQIIELVQGMADGMSKETKFRTNQ